MDLYDASRAGLPVLGTRWWALETLSLLLVGIVFTATVASCWPYVRFDPLGHLFEILANSVRFTASPGSLYRAAIHTSPLPWHYLPVWFAIGTPLFLLGLVLAFPLLHPGWRKSRLAFLLLSVLVLQAGLWIVVRPVIYNGLRHYLFLYPVLAALAALGLSAHLRERRLPWREDAVVWLVLAGMAVTGWRMARLHPYEYVYFNALAGGHRGVQGRFETDYWCASEREAYRWLLARGLLPSGSPWTVATSGCSFQFKQYVTPGVTYTPEREGAHYALINNTEYAVWAPEARPALERDVIHRVEREGAPLCFIWMNPRPPRGAP
jgi:hypothetical protein